MKCLIDNCVHFRHQVSEIPPLEPLAVGIIKSKVTFSVQEPWGLSPAQHWPHIGGLRQQPFIISRQRKSWRRRWGWWRHGAAPTWPHLSAGQARPHRDCWAACRLQGLQQVGAHCRLFDDPVPTARDFFRFEIVVFRREEVAVTRVE
jgi:hypothetical protein